MREGCRKFIGASGGNAGLAVAYSAHELNIPAQLFVPTNTSEGMINKIRSYGATVTVIEIQTKGSAQNHVYYYKICVTILLDMWG